jgi:hypothetical protein
MDREEEKLQPFPQNSMEEQQSSVFSRFRQQEELPKN